jgi:hypothetical protein
MKNEEAIKRKENSEQRKKLLEEENFRNYQEKLK